MLVSSVNGQKNMFDLMEENDLIPSIAGAEFNDAITDWAAESYFIEVLDALDAFTDPDLDLIQLCNRNSKYRRS